MNKWAISGVVVVLLLIALRVGITLTHHESDRDQILSALDDSIKASREGKPGGVMALLSNKLTVNSQDQSGSMGQLTKFIKQQRPDIKIVNSEPVITGEDAQIVSPVDISVSFLGQSRSIHLINVVLMFKKEAATELVVIPTTKWRLTDVQVPEQALSEFN